MHNPGPSHLMIAIGLPHAQPNKFDRREGHGNGGQNGDGGDIAEEAVRGIIDNLHEKGPAAIGLLRLLSKSLARMCEAVEDRDEHALQLAAGAAHKALSGLIQD
jgi:hypothetical protein